MGGQAREVDRGQVLEQSILNIEFEVFWFFGFFPPKHNLPHNKKSVCLSWKVPYLGLGFMKMNLMPVCVAGIRDVRG